MMNSDRGSTRSIRGLGEAINEWLQRKSTEWMDKFRGGPPGSSTRSTGPDTDDDTPWGR